MSKIYYVYILLCSDGSYYTGLTNDIDRRLKEHESGFYKDSYTSMRRPVKLMWHSEFSNVAHAFEIERRIKNWSSHKKRALIKEDWDLLKFLSECKNDSNSKFFSEK